MLINLFPFFLHHPFCFIPIFLFVFIYNPFCSSYPRPHFTFRLFLFFSIPSAYSPFLYPYSSSIFSSPLVLSCSFSSLSAPSYIWILYLSPIVYFPTVYDFDPPLLSRFCFPSRFHSFLRVPHISSCSSLILVHLSPGSECRCCL